MCFRFSNSPFDSSLFSGLNVPLGNLLQGGAILGLGLPELESCDGDFLNRLHHLSIRISLYTSRVASLPQMESLEFLSLTFPPLWSWYADSVLDFSKLPRLKHLSLEAPDDSEQFITETPIFSNEPLSLEKLCITGLSCDLLLPFVNQTIRELDLDRCHHLPGKDILVFPNLRVLRLRTLEGSDFGYVGYPSCTKVIR